MDDSYQMLSGFYPLRRYALAMLGGGVGLAMVALIYLNP